MNCFDSFECKATIMNQMQLNPGKWHLSTQKAVVYEHLCHEERQRELGRLSLEKRSFRRTSKYINTSREGAKRMELGSWQDQRQWSQSETQNVPSEHQEIHFHCKDDTAMAQVVHGSCRVFILGDMQRPSEQGPGQLALGGLAWAEGLDQMPSRGSKQPPFHPVTLTQHQQIDVDCMTKEIKSLLFQDFWTVQGWDG